MMWITHIALAYICVQVIQIVTLETLLSYPEYLMIFIIIICNITRI